MTTIVSRRTVMGGAAATGLGVLASAIVPSRAVATGSTGSTGSHRQLAFLNHTYTSLDQVTADAVASSDFLRSFGAFQLRTTTNGDQTYSGRYLLGRATYLEMFAEGELPAPDDQLGATGLAHSPDRAGTIDEIKQRMIALGVTDPLDVIQTKEVEREQIPWFRVVAPTVTSQASFPWVMEYVESYFDDPRTHSEPADFPGDVSRERYNPDDYATKMMRDVAGAEIGVPQADLEAIEITLRACGLQVRTSSTGIDARGRGERLAITAAAPSQIGWRRIGFVLNRDVRRRRVERIGASTLTVGPGRRAVWTFG